MNDFACCTTERAVLFTRNEWMIIIISRRKYLLPLLFILVCLPVKPALAQLVIHTKTAIQIELKGFNGLSAGSLFKGDLVTGKEYTIDTPYRGLALLVFPGGQQYPVIIGDRTIQMTITTPALPPSFENEDENANFYRMLAGEAPDTEGSDFASIMWQARQLLESSNCIHTLADLESKKQAFHAFVRRNFSKLQYSDMLQRLMAQYFMMHEYVRYHRKGAPPAESRLRYQREVLAGVGSWIAILHDHIPGNKVLNYCVSLYYERGMVTLAFMIVKNFKEIAYCPGQEPESFSFPDDLQLARSDGGRAGKLGEFESSVIFAFVSENCPVSMTMTVIKARELTEYAKDQVLIVAPLQKLSKKHLAMNSYVSGGKMLFIDDEKWRKANLPEKLRLPLFIRVEAASK